MKVYVYFNLHKKCFSVKALEGADKGRVIAHTSELDLYDVEFKVSEAGRQRVIREKRKNVHAGVVGFTDTELAFIPELDRCKSVTYNPYRFASFVCKDTEQPVKEAAYARLSGRSIQALI